MFRQTMKLGLCTLIAASLGLVGCGGDTTSGHTKKVIKYDDVPQKIRDIAVKELPEHKLDEAFKKFDKKSGDFISYEIRGKNPKTGKINEIGIAESGEILDRE